MNDDVEELQDAVFRFRAMMDQSREVAVELAHQTAAFYNALIEDGVDRVDATELTREYVASMLNAPDEE